MNRYRYEVVKYIRMSLFFKTCLYIYIFIFIYLYLNVQTDQLHCFVTHHLYSVCDNYLDDNKQYNVWH